MPLRTSRAIHPFAESGGGLTPLAFAVQCVSSRTAQVRESHSKPYSERRRTEREAKVLTDLVEVTTPEGIALAGAYFAPANVGRSYLYTFSHRIERLLVFSCPAHSLGQL